MNPATADRKTTASRAAAIISALGPDALSRLSGSLGPEERRALSKVAEQGAHLSSEERRRLLASFTASVREADSQPAPEERSTPATRGRGDRAVIQQPSVSQPPDPPNPFAFLDGVDGAVLARALGGENPAIIALVATLAPSDASQALLSSLPAATRHEVALAIADLGRPCPGVVSCLSKALLQQVSSLQAEAGRRRSGVQTVVRALSVAGEDVLRESLAALRVKNPELAEDVIRELELVAWHGASPVADDPVQFDTPAIPLPVAPAVRPVSDAVSRGVLIPVADMVG